MATLRRAPVMVGALLSLFIATTAAQADEPPQNDPPVLSNFSVTPSTLGHEGGPVMISVTATDFEDGIESVIGAIHFSGGGWDSVGMVEGDSEVWSGTVSVPPNLTDAPVNHQVEIMATDRRGAQTIELMGDVQVEAAPPFDEPPIVGSASVTPTSLPVTGGSVTISADASDDRALSEVYAEITGPDGSTEAAPMPGTGSAGHFEGSWAAPENLAADPAVYTVAVIAMDDIGQWSSAPAGEVVVAGTGGGGENPLPVLSNFQANPSSMGHEGGTTEVSVTVTDDDPIDLVSATIYYAAGGSESATLTETAGVWSGTLDVPANFTDGAVNHNIEVSATDAEGGITTELLGSVDVDAQPQFDEPPIVSESSATPPSLPSTGGDVTISTRATDTGGISEVNAVIEDEDGATWNVTLEATDADHYAGTWTAPANTTPDPRTYTITVTASDSIGQQTSETTEPVTVAAVVVPPDRAFLEPSKRKLRFLHVPVGRERERSFTLTNTGGSSVGVRLDKPSHHFRVKGGESARSFILAPDASKRITVIYRPTEPGRDRARLRIERDDGRQRGLAVRLKGTSVAPRASAPAHDLAW